MKLPIPNKPNRSPDLVIEDNISSFWWEERVFAADNECWHFNPDSMTYYDRNRWISFNRGFKEKYGHKFKESYANWLLEKELKV